MKIVFVNFASEWGGGEGWTQRTACGLEEKGHGVYIIGRKNTPFPAKCRESGLKVSEMDISFDYNPKTVFRLRSLFKAHSVDVVVVHHNKDVRLAGVAARLSGIPVLHRNGFPVIHDNIRHLFTSLFINRIITNSRRIKDHYRTFSWLKSKPVDVVPNGIKLLPTTIPDRNQFWDNNQSVIDAKRDLIALYSGRLTKVKQVDILLKAISQIADFTRWKLAILGDGSEKETLTKMVNELSLNDHVVFLGFRRDSAELTAFADLVVLPSKDEGMPNSLMEAMSHKTAVAASPAGDVEYLLDDGNAGWVLHNNTPNEWKELLQKLEKEPNLLKEMGKRGFERIVADFSFEKMITGVEESLHKTTRTP